MRIIVQTRPAPDGRITAMNENTDLGIDVSLFCPEHHHIGNLMKFSAQIGFRPRDGQLAAWPPHQSDMWWEVRCPDGCPGVLGGPIDPIRTNNVDFALACELPAGKRIVDGRVSAKITA